LDLIFVLLFSLVFGNFGGPFAFSETPTPPLEHAITAKATASRTGFTVKTKSTAKNSNPKPTLEANLLEQIRNMGEAKP
jgi:hypothetical protein